MPNYVVRVWLPDRPGALGQVASRIGAVRGDVVGIDILETGNGQAVDELVVVLPEPELLDLLVHEVTQVDGVKVEDVRRVEAMHDPRLDALETVALLVGAGTRRDLLEAVGQHAGRSFGADWVAVVDLDGVAVAMATPGAPSGEWLAAFLLGSRSAAVLAGVGGDSDDVAWAPLAAAGLALVVGRSHTAYRTRERRQLAAVARIVDTRWGELAPEEVVGGNAGCDGRSEPLT